ncbi:hypothetical protein CDAR_597951 [Caerostris darwini]|uniref:Uncharacterized protein n=1 Tax=Caerostris darwini TaxID=1538125 RepID=A0AAV4MFH5_9ARAC|nr:hypothetical protein CDAR_597951 [Caerostris darwini]
MALMECDDPQRHRGFCRGMVLTTGPISEPKSAKTCPGRKLNMITTPTGSIFALMECDDPQRPRGFRWGPVLTTRPISEPKSAKTCPSRGSARSV